MTGGGEAESASAEPTDADFASIVDEVEGAVAPETVAAPAEGEAAPVEGEKPPELEAKPDDKPPVPETPEAKKLQDGFKALAKDRKRIQAREQEATAAIERSKAFETKATHFDAVVKRIHEDPHGLLMEAGGDALVNKLLEQVGASAKSPAEIEIAKLRAERDAERAQAAADKQAARVAEWQRQVIAEVEKAGDKFDLVNSLGHHDAVIETIVQYHQKYNGAVLPVEVAAQAVEQRLAAGLGKSKKFGPREAVKPPAPKAPPAPAKKGGLTLTSLGNGEPSSPTNGAAPLDDDARFAATLRELETEGLL